MLLSFSFNFSMRVLDWGNGFKGNYLLGPPGLVRLKSCRHWSVRNRLCSRRFLLRRWGCCWAFSNHNLNLNNCEKNGIQNSHHGIPSSSERSAEGHQTRSWSLFSEIINAVKLVKFKITFFLIMVMIMSLILSMFCLFYCLRSRSRSSSTFWVSSMILSWSYAIGW